MSIADIWREFRRSLMSRLERTNAYEMEPRWLSKRPKGWTDASLEVMEVVFYERRERRAIRVLLSKDYDGFGASIDRSGERRDVLELCILTNSEKVLYRYVPALFEKWMISKVSEEQLDPR